MNASLIRSVVESTNAPNGVVFPSARFTLDHGPDADPQSTTPAVVRAFGVMRVRVRPVIEREASRRAPVVYVAFRLIESRLRRSGAGGGAPR